MKAWYQEATINGAIMPTQRQRDTSLLRWENLIAPILPAGGYGRLLVDLGANAGLYCRLAREWGYRTIAVEKDAEYLSHARFWERTDPKGVQIVASDILDYDLPACQTVLLCQVHYWLTSDQLDRLLQTIHDRAVSLIVVGRNHNSDMLASPVDKQSMLDRLSDWSITAESNTKKHWSILARNNNLYEADTKELFSRQPFITSRRYLSSFQAFIDGEEKPFEAYLKWRHFRGQKADLTHYRDLVRSVRANGILRPLIVNDDALIDGNHRLIIAERLGIEKVICRQQSFG